MATTIKLKNGSGAPLAGDLVQGEPAFDLTNKRLYTEDSGGSVIEVGTNPTSLTVSGDLAVDTNTLYVDSTNNRVGIGAASPTYTLEVANALRADSTRFIVDSGNGGTATSPALVFDGDADSGIFHPLSNTLAFSTLGTERLRIRPSGEVGIGTDNPINALVVSDGDDGIELRTNLTDDNRILSYNRTTSDHTKMSFDAANYDFRIGAQAPSVVIDSNGNFGIGESDPDDLLHLTSGAPAIRIEDTSVAGEYTRILQNGGGFFIQVDEGNVNAGSYFRIDVDGDEAMRIDASGNVGIGTSIPTAVKGGRAVQAESNTGAEFIAGNNLTSTAGGEFIGAFLFKNSDASADQPHYAGMWGEARDSFGFTNLHFSAGRDRYETDVTDMFIQADTGNVGIGETNPARVVHIKNSIPAIRMEDSDTTSIAELLMTADNNLSIRLDEDNTVASSYMDFRVDGSEAMRIDSNGRVGIGQTVPNYSVDVKSSSGAFTAINIEAPDDTGISHLFFSDSTNAIGRISYEHSNNSLSFRTNGLESMRIDSSGNLLVGRTSTGAGTTDYGTELYGSGGVVQYINVSGTNGGHIWYNNVGTKIAEIRGNGGFANYQANDANLSDQRSKKDIVDSGVYLEKLCNIPIRNFRYKHDEPDGKHHLGVIAQEVEAVAPEFVHKNSWEFEGEQLDSVYNTDLMFAMMKSIQELSAQVTELKAEVAALKGA